MGPAIARGGDWQNRRMRWRMFFLLLGLPSVLLVGLVLVIRGGQSDVRESAGAGSSGGGVSSAMRGSYQARERTVSIMRWTIFS